MLSSLLFSSSFVILLVISYEGFKNFFPIFTNKLLNDIAIKRLDAIKEFTELGSGYRIAMRDLALRGAGDILGDEQSGFVSEVGFDLYMRLIEEEIKRLKGEKFEEIDDVSDNSLIDVDTHTIENYKANLEDELNEKFLELEYKIKHPHTLNSSPYRQYKEEMLKLKREKHIDDAINLPDIPDIGRYNPNYDSIRTHSYNPSFASTDFHNFNKYKKNVKEHQLSLAKKEDNQPIIQNRYPNRNNRSTLYSEYLNTDPNNTSNINDKSQSNMKSTDFNISQYMSTSSFGDEKNNHCLKFDSYSTRKPMVTKTLYNSDIKEHITNYNPIRNVKGNVDFNKISSNSHILSYFDEIAKNNNNPPLGMYRPNYDYIAKKPVNIYLNKKDPPSPKIAKLKKIIYSYNISSEYKMVSTLNNYNKPKYSFDTHN